MYLLKILVFQTLLFSNLSKPDHNNPSPRTGPQDSLVTPYDCEENEQKTSHKHAKQPSHSMRIRTTTNRKDKHLQKHSKIVLLTYSEIFV